MVPIDLRSDLQLALTFVDKHHLHDRVQRNVDLVRAHAVGPAVRRAVVAVAKLFRIDLVVLREERRRW